MSRNGEQFDDGRQQMALGDEPKQLDGGEILLARAHHSHGDKGDSGHHHGRGGSKHHRPVDPVSAYWSRIESARHHGEFVTDFPPVHPGIDNPKALHQSDSLFPKQGAQPSLNDIISASKNLFRIGFHDKHKPDFNLTRVDEQTFKDRYAQEAVNVGAKYGINKDNVQNIVQRIYAFEDGGWGTHETLSSMPEILLKPENEARRKAYHPLSSALGYNQLMLANSVTDVKQHGADMGSRLQDRVALDPGRKDEISTKSDLLKALQAAKGDGADGKGLHALNLDGDVGPVMQSVELENLFKFARDNDFSGDLGKIAARINANAAKYDALPAQQKAAAVDEVMARVKMPPDVNATSDPNSQQWQADKDDLRRRVASLPAGDSDLLNRDKLTVGEYGMVNTQLMGVRKYGGEAGPLSPNAKLLMDKLDTIYFHGVSADSLMPAALELANLAGLERAKSMIKEGHDALPTANFFSRAGYEGNPVVARRSAGELLMQINRVMYGPNSSQTRDGIRQFEAAFSKIPDLRP